MLLQEITVCQRISSTRARTNGRSKEEEGEEEEDEDEAGEEEQWLCNRMERERKEDGVEDEWFILNDPSVILTGFRRQIV